MLSFFYFIFIVTIELRISLRVSEIHPFVALIMVFQWVGSVMFLTSSTTRLIVTTDTLTHYSDSEPTSLCSFSLMLLQPTICRTRDEHANHYATDAVFKV
jgi:hypothetical protein